ncbi:protein JTB isoform X1 [Brienomyrus brachyistius]|uniref:protein JTB isoform X1 n=1 Tax=Brienomyrus brachyistius TaxID=42636 RepID=UPI0020B3DBDA|nr:protein JTB isoform X1 [Brienomyrus brachyistius]XP_048849932.1 protein JTB isoform X1 [Brienomyrus brachyistius]
MESDCRIPIVCVRPRTLALNLLFWGVISLRVFGAALLGEERSSVDKTASTPCWKVEEFMVMARCAQCSTFQSKSVLACSPTGYVERIVCAKSNRDEFKSCRSSLLEEQLFWRFEGTVLGLMVLFALLVVLRQRSLDRLASEKVRRQIESI